MKALSPICLQGVLLLACIGSLRGQSAEAHPKLVPRPLPGLRMPALPSAHHPAPPPTGAEKAAVVSVPSDNPDRARILGIRRRPPQPQSAGDSAKAKEIKAPRTQEAKSPEARQGKIRIIPKAEVAGLLATEAAEQPDAKPSPEVISPSETKSNGSEPKLKVKPSTP